MNERIYDMAARAAEHALLNPSEDALQSEAEGYDTITVPRQFIDKFAELVVKECANVAGFNDKDAFVSLRIKQHFGVE